MKIAPLALSILTVLGLTQAQVTSTNYATGPTQLDVDTFAVAPSPLCVNKIMCQTATGTLTTPVIAGAKLAITGSAQGFPCPIPVTMHALTACVLAKPSCPVGVAMAMTFAATYGDGGTLYCQTVLPHYSGTMMAINCPP
ncbi:MAG: hypothetical protein JOS17DRAFT_842290 [Linnemannia elongata]|nr:MAG: hypothetical protein JOS17DRAFT_842290 [Linnemannia elongata]